MNKNTTFSLEVFPPKDDVGIDAIYRNLYEFATFSPDYISVTYSAGGSGGTGTADIASTVQNIHKIKAVAHVTCIGETKESVSSTLNTIKTKGVNTVLALRGDRRENAELTDFKFATDLIEFIRARGDFEIYAACYPEGHPESTCYNQDVDVMKRKYDLGVRHFISQLFFDNDDFYKMRDEASKKGINCEIVAGIMPITNAKQILRTVSKCGAKIPAKLAKIINKFEDNPAAMRRAGLNYCVQQITDLIANEVSGIHLYAMNNPETTRVVVDGVGTILKVVNE